MSKPIRFICLLILGAAMNLSFAGNFFPYQYETYKLPNGLTSYLIPVKGSGLVAYYSIVRTGSRDEWEPGHSGFAHFFEHMMFRGTKQFPGAVYDSLVTSMGADANAYTTDDYTCYYLVLPGSKLELAMTLESDRFQNLSYSEREFKTEAGAVYGEFRKGRVNPWSVLEENLYNLAFDVHTYKHTTIGFEEDIKRMPEMYDYSKNFFKRYYRPENVVLVIVGDFDPEATKTLIKKYYGNWQRGYIAPKITPEPPQKSERRKTVIYKGRTLPILAMAYKGPAFDPKDKMSAAVYLLGELAFGQNSDLYRRLVIKEQKVQFLGGDFSFHRDPNLLTVFSMIKDENDIDYVESLIEETIRKMQQNSADARQLEDLKKRLRYGFLMNLDTPSKIAGRLARIIAMSGRLEAVDELYSTIDQLTPDDIRAAAGKFLQKSHRTVIVLKGEK
ncbi:MAG: insulinase family protein [Calditrichaeota bacterium]|nr:insulinase family protein [Calditrichota bacterium]